MAADIDKVALNRLLADTFQEMSRHLMSLCRDKGAPMRAEDTVQAVIPLVCGCHNRLRGLVGRLMILAQIDRPCCYPGAIEGKTPCGVPYPQTPDADDHER